MMPLHIAAGIVALIAGFIALYAAKGAWLHRRSGNIFSYAMLLMTALATVMALTTHPNRINVIAGSLTFYLVATGLLTVIRSAEQQRRWLLGLSAIVAVVTVAAWQYGMLARITPGGKVDHIPAGAIFMFATVGTLGFIGDARMLLRGAIQGRQRLTRHLWRMGYALWIASTSAFFGQARHLPQWMRDAHLTAVPILLVTATVLFWLVRVQVRASTVQRTIA
jgi:hypothetical protein